MCLVDCDEQIAERENMAVSEIFSRFGENYFRKLESDLLTELENRKQPLVIATGGGMPVFADNLERLSKLGITVYLYTNTGVLEKRLKGQQDRPLLALHEGETLQDKLSAQLSKRESTYQKASLQIDTSQLTLEEVVERILTTVKLQAITKEGS